MYGEKPRDAAVLAGDGMRHLNKLQQHSCRSSRCGCPNLCMPSLFDITMTIHHTCAMKPHRDDAPAGDFHGKLIAIEREIGDLPRSSLFLTTVQVYCEGNTGKHR